MYTLGVDVHKKYSQVAVLNEQGTLLMNTRIPNNRTSIASLVEQLADEPGQAVLETGYSWGIMYDLLKEQGIEVTVANAVQVKAIASAQIKTDTIDAYTLAKLLRVGLIPAVHIPSKEIRSLKDMVRQRCWLVKIKTMLKNRTHAVVARNHIECPFTDMFGKGGMNFLKGLALPEPDRSILAQDLSLYACLKDLIKESEQSTDTSLQSNRLYALIATVPGFGKILSALAALEIDTIERFHNAGKLAGYSGLVPRVYSSGGRTVLGALVPGCNRWLRYAFVEAAWCAITTSPYFRSLYQRHRAKGPQTAIIVVARRLAEVVFCCLKNNRPYEERPFALRRNHAA